MRNALGNAQKGTSQIAVDPRWKVYEDAQNGLDEITLAHAFVVEAAVNTIAVRCEWPETTITRLRGYASKQLREIVAQHARDNDSLMKLSEFALKQVVVYLIAQDESRPWLQRIHEQERERERLRKIQEGEKEPPNDDNRTEKQVLPFTRPYDPKDEGMLSALRKMAVNTILEQLSHAHAIGGQEPMPSGVVDAWTAVRNFYGATKFNDFTKYLFDRNKLQIGKFQRQVAPSFVKEGGVTELDIQSILKIGFFRAIPRWVPHRGSFEATALEWLKKSFWEAPEVLNGCPQDVFRLIGIIWKIQSRLINEAGRRKPTHDEIANRINELGGFRGKPVTTKQVADALKIARTMPFESLTAMEQINSINQDGDSFADPLEEGPLAKDAAALIYDGFADPAKQYEMREFEKLAEEILSPLELEVFGSRVLEEATWAEIAAEMTITGQQARNLHNQAREKLRADRRVQAVFPLNSR